MRYVLRPIGRPSLLPGTYFRLLLIGYFEGIDSERGIAWRTADSLALRGWSVSSASQSGNEDPKLCGTVAIRLL